MNTPGKVSQFVSQPMGPSCEEVERKRVLRKALDAIDCLQAELNTARQDHCEPIAIVGLSCRFPGSSSPEEYWRLLHGGVNAVTQAPAGRWDNNRDKTAPYGGFLDRVDLFDPGFFGISGREAESMDPQQRLVLEVAWEALENAGIAPHKLHGTAAGVFMGITMTDYGRLAISRNQSSLDVYTATGGALNVAAGRLSYLLGLHGPAMAVETACSSSLVAVHLACQSLRCCESNLAFAGGVNVLLAPEPFVCFEKWGMMARDGRCKTFDEAADGFVRGEGCGVIVLKRLSDALAAGDRVMALIRGTAVNQDGASSGLTVPNGLAQQAVVRAALRAASLQPEEVDYIEAHGTGTTLGDPIELEALAAVFGENRPAERPLLVGSVKTNLGHLESASGIAGLIKVVLALQNEEIPAHLHFRKLSSRISLGEAAIKIPACAIPWRQSARQRVAGVSSFGLSGTNAHAILQEAPAAKEPIASAITKDRPAHLLVLSAESETALKELAKSWSEHLGNACESRWSDICHTAAVGRSPLSFRLALPMSDLASARTALSVFAQGVVPPGGLSGRRRAGVKIAFLFTGEGAQYPAMGAALYQSEPVFRAAFDQCAAIIGDQLDEPLQRVIAYEAGKGGDGSTGLLDRGRYGQPAVFAFQYALAALWRSWGIEPSAVAGIDLGEYAAACVAGALGLEDALRLVVLRARLAPALAPDNFAHPGLDEFKRLLAGVRCAEPSLDVASSVSGTILTPETRMDGAYWQRHAGATPRFAESICALYARGIRVFLEIGPAPNLIGIARKLVDDPAAVWLASLSPKTEVWSQMLSTLGALFVQGINPDWDAYDKPHSRRRIGLPTYPFQRKRFWLPETAAVAQAPAGTHPLLGWHLTLAKQPDTHIWQSELSLERCPWLKDHQVQGVAVVPATAFIELAIAAASQTLAQLPLVISEIEIEKVLALHPGVIVELQTRLEPSADGAFQFEICSQKKSRDDGWICHARGSLRIGAAETPSAKLDIEAIRQRCSQSLAGSDFYELHRQRGNQWGPSFQGLRRLWFGEGEALSEVEPPESVKEELSHFQLHPALSDAAGHVLTATLPLERRNGQRGGAFVGAGIETIRFHRRPEGARLWAHARIRKDQQTSENVLLGDVHVYDLSGNLVSETLGARLWYLDPTRRPDFLNEAQNWLYEPRWVNRNRNTSARGPLSGTWMVFGDSHGVGQALCAALRARGASCISVCSSEQGFQTDGMSMTVRPENLEDYTRALAAAAAGGPIRGVVHLWSLDSVNPEMADLAAVGRAQSCGPASVLRLVQAMAQSQPNGGVKLWLATQGAQPAGQEPSPLSLLQSPLWGLGRTIAVEHSEIWGGQVDLDPSDAPATSANLLLEQITDPEGEDQVAFRGGVRRVLRLAQCEGPKRTPHTVKIRPDASYLITGGLGGIGLATAQWLADQGARHLVLAGRTPVPSRSEWGRLQLGTPEAGRVEAIGALERQGVTVRTVSVDMGDESSVSLLMREILADKDAPIRGVLHAAGIMQYHPLCGESPERLREVLAAKMVGGWLLHRGFAKTDLDFFVLFSSSSSLLSSPLMGGYSAANAFLDSLAHHRRAMGQTALSINWGTWRETGMATRFLSDEGFKRQGRSGATKGIDTLPTKEALEAFSYLLGSGQVQAGVIPVNWEEWRRAYGSLASAPYLALVLPEFESPRQSEPSGERERERILSLSGEAREIALGESLTQKVAAILKVPAESIDGEKPISSLGFDSLMSLELKTQIEKDLAAGVAMARLLEGPTLLELRQLLMDLLVKPISADRPVMPSVRATEWEEGQL